LAIAAMHSCCWSTWWEIRPWDWQY